MMDHLFVYGTLLRRIGHPMHARLARGAEFVGEAIVQGRLYDLGRYPGLVPSQAPEDKVFGELYRLRDAAVLRALDDYEGCGPGDPEPHEYARLTHPVELAGGARVAAWMYILKRPADGLRRIVSGRFGED